MTERPVRDHVIDGGSCWCRPTVEFVGDGHTVIHNEEPL